MFEHTHTHHTPTYDRYRSDFVRNVSTDFQTYSAISKENQIVQSVQSQKMFALRLYCLSPV